MPAIGGEAPLLKAKVISDNEHTNQIVSFSVWRCCSSLP
jgi:hypothetical protein